MVLLAQISDLHLDETERTARRAHHTIDYLRSLPRPVDALLVTGDIADHGSAAEYRIAADLLDVPFPVLSCPGNHDDRAAYRTVLLGESHAAAGEQAVLKGPVNQLYRVTGANGTQVAVLLCDSTIPGKAAGLLAPETLDWLDTALHTLTRDEPNTPALVAFHHPPAVLHHPLPDGLRLQQPGALADVLARHLQVVAVLTGHAHAPAVTQFAGRPLIAGPATTWTLRLPWEGDEAADREQPPGLAFHVLSNDAADTPAAVDDLTVVNEPDEPDCPRHRLTTHFRVVPMPTR